MRKIQNEQQGNLPKQSEVKTMNTVQKIIQELEQLAQLIQEEELHRVATMLVHTKYENQRIFLAGAGRSGCVVKAFANRLLHLGLLCYVVGDLTTPPIQKDDILFVLSGSGKTSSLVSMSKKAKQMEAKIVTITLQENGDIGMMADACIVLAGTTRLQNKESFHSIQPTGSSFEQLAWLTCDALVMILKENLHMSNEDLLKHHANLE